MIILAWDAASPNDDIPARSICNAFPVTDLTRGCPGPPGVMLPVPGPEIALVTRRAIPGGIFRPSPDAACFDAVPFPEFDDSLFDGDDHINGDSLNSEGGGLKLVS